MKDIRLGGNCSTRILIALATIALAGPVNAGSMHTGSFAKATSAAPVTQVVAHGLGETPKALVMWSDGAADSTVGTVYQFAYGVSDGTTQVALAAANVNLGDNSDSRRRMARKLISFVVPGADVGAEADLVSWDATNLTLNWTVNDATPAIIHFLAIGGSEVEAKVSQWQMKSGTLGPQVVSGVGFKPSVVLLAHVGSSFIANLPATTSKAAFGLGAMDAAGNQWNSHFLVGDSGPNTDTQHYQSTSAVVAGIATDLKVTKEASFVSMDADGFTLNWGGSIDNNASQVVSLALGGLAASAGSFTKTTALAPVSQAVSGLSFRPQAVIFASDQCAAQAAPAAQASLGFGVATASGSATVAFSDSDKLALNRVTSYQAQGQALVKLTGATPTLDAAATLGALSPGGFALDWSSNDAVPSQILYLALAPSFATARWPIPVGPQDLAAVDLNGDGLNDLVVVHPTLSRLSVSLAHAPGRFDAPVYFATASAPSQVVLGDLDHDGALDAVVSLTAGGVSVLKGDGQGGLGTPSTFAAGEGPMGIVLLDLDQNGTLDVAVADAATSQIVLLEGDGLGGLQPAGFIATGSGPDSLTSGDLNGDGIADLVTCLPQSGQIAVALGLVQGGFGAPNTFAAGSGPSSVALGDLDGDGLLDAAVADTSANAVLVLRGSGSGGFGQPTSFATGSGPSEVFVARLDQDCALDVATANRVSDDLTVLLGNGGGGLTAGSAFAVGGAPTSLHAADIDGDGRTDLATTVPTTDQVVILGNEELQPLGIDTTNLSGPCGGGVFELRPRFSGPALPAAVYTWDFGDGTPVQSTSMVDPVMHFYAAGGVYFATLSAEGISGGCLASSRVRVEVPQPLVAAAVGPGLICAPIDTTGFVSFALDASVSTALNPGRKNFSYQWTTPAGAVQIADPASPVTELLVPAILGSVDIPLALTVSDAEGCADTRSLIASLDLVPRPALSAESTRVCAGSSTRLDAGPGFVAYQWTTGETTRAIQVTPSADTTYTVNAQDALGCWASAAITITIRPDTPVVTPVPAVRVAKAAEGHVVVSYDDIGAGVYTLMRATSAGALGAATPVAQSQIYAPFDDLAPGTAYYAVRGASACSGVVGP